MRKGNALCTVYQKKAAAAIHREWDAGNKKTLVVMPTGTGKTIVFASIVNDQVEKGEHVLILAHREELLQQAAQNARKQIARRGETAVYATVEEAEAWVEQQKAARTRR